MDHLREVLKLLNFFILITRLQVHEIGLALLVVEIVVLAIISPMRGVYDRVLIGGILLILKRRPVSNDIKTLVIGLISNYPFLIQIETLVSIRRAKSLGVEMR